MQPLEVEKLARKERLQADKCVEPNSVNNPSGSGADSSLEKAHHDCHRELLDFV